MKCFLSWESVSLSPNYKYLGIVMSSRLSWSPAQKTLSQQSQKAMYFISKMNRECNFSFSCNDVLFDKCVVPIVTYGSEIWGVNVHNSIEDILLKHRRQQLGVGSRSPIPALLGECGRHKLNVVCYLKCIRYWLKLINASNDSLLNSCYKMLYNLNNAGRQNWASYIRNILYKFGFGYIWELQRIDDENNFLDEFKRRVLDCDRQNWRDSMLTLPKLRTLCVYKTQLLPEPYLLLCIPRRIIVALAKFRIYK